MDSPYQACRELFSRYPQAVRIVDASATVHSMVAMVQAGEYAGFYALVQDSNDGAPTYLLWPWPAGDIVGIAEESDGAVPDLVTHVMNNGVPIPRDGSLLGWVHDGSVTTLMATYAESAPDLAEPVMAVMPLEGTSEAHWAPYTSKRPFDCWSWEEWRAGRVISLDEVIAANPATVWWVDTNDALGSNCCVVARDVITPQGHVLCRGRYVYYGALQAGEPIPTLEDLLASAGRLDLSSRFQPGKFANSCL
jgi:hypothetical protein